MLSEASMGPPQDSISFVLNGSVQWDSHWEDTGSSAAEQEILRQIGANEDGRLFNVEDVQLLQGSGAFFALKIQKAKNKEQLKESVKEAESLRKLKGCPSIVQIVDHALVEPASLLLILMELGACDLHSFLQKSLADLSVPDVCRIWRSLVPAVTAAHGQGIIHRDIKPQNFLLVPVTPFADRVLATTSVPSDKFVFQMADDEDDEDDHLLGEGGGMPGDVKLFIRDPSTGKEEILRLRIKLTDFGLAQPLEIDESHLSVKGCAGSILYMAPETLRPTKFGGTKKVSNNVDIWALGVILFRMLHDNRTPFETYHRADGPIGVAGAATNKEIHREVTAFGRQRLKVWMVERDKMLASEKVAAHLGATEELVPAREEAMARALLRTWMQTEFLFRMCEFCLAFDATDRVIARDLGRWIEAAFENKWWQDKVCAAEERHAGPVQHHNVLRVVGRIITEAALPEVFRRNLVNGNGSGAVVPHVDGNRPARGSGRSCLLISLLIAALVIGSVLGCFAYLNQHQSGHNPQPSTLQPPGFLDSLPSTTTGGSPFAAGGAPGGAEAEGVPGGPEGAPGAAGGAPGTVGGPPGTAAGPPGPVGAPPGSPTPSGFLDSLPSKTATPEVGVSADVGSPTNLDVDDHIHGPPAPVSPNSVSPDSDSSATAPAQQASPLSIGPQTQTVCVCGPVCVCGLTPSSPPHTNNGITEFPPANERMLSRIDNLEDLKSRLQSREYQLLVLETMMASFNGPEVGRVLKMSMNFTFPLVNPLSYVSSEDRDFVLDLVKRNGFALQFLPDLFRVDRDVVLAAVGQNGYALQYVFSPVRSDVQVVLAAVGQNGYALKYAYLERRADAQVALAAVAQDSGALQFVSEGLRDDRKFMLAAEGLRGDSSALKYASKRLIDDPSFLEEAEVVVDPILGILGIIV